MGFTDIGFTDISVKRKMQKGIFIKPIESVSLRYQRPVFTGIVNKKRLKEQCQIEIFFPFFFKITHRILKMF